MSTFKEIDLKTENGNYLHYNEDYLEPYKNELYAFLEGQEYMQTLGFAKAMMMSQEIKANNTIEGIQDDLSVIDEVIKQRKSPVSQRQKARIISLYHAYQYILTHHSIDKEHLKELYAILSKGNLSSDTINHMGKYYRTTPVYISKGCQIGNEFLGIDANKLDYYMDMFFAYVNDNSNISSSMDAFIKSQIMHFYFVYIHPYYDINGRASRTTSMWYLLNQEAYSYIIFNRAIAFAKQEYEKNIIKARLHGDVTLFLKYILIHVEKELEKEYLIHSIQQKSGQLTKENAQMLEYLLSMRGSITVKDLITTYNQFNEHQRPSVVYKEKILPLLQKEIILPRGDTKGFIFQDTPNFHISLNPQLVNIDPSKTKNLRLERVIR